jgi:hypothetical protein
VPSSSGPTNNGPICTGNNVTLTANSSNATAWSWSGPAVLHLPCRIRQLLLLLPALIH